MTNPMSGAELRMALQHLNWTQEHLADNFDISLRTVQGWVAHGVDNSPAAMYIRNLVTAKRPYTMLAIGYGGKL